MVRSMLEYAAPIWSPTYKYLIIAIERLQRRATNYIINNPKRPNPLHLDYKERLLRLKLLPLTYRREIMDIQLFLKIWNTPTKLGLDQLLNFRQPTTGTATRSMTKGLTLNTTKTRLISTAHFYPFRLSQTWNRLPYQLREKIRFLQDSHKVKTILTPYYIDKLERHFDPDNTCTWVSHCDCYRCKPM